VQNQEQNKLLEVVKVVTWRELQLLCKLKKPPNLLFKKKTSTGSLPNWRQRQLEKEKLEKERTEEEERKKKRKINSNGTCG